MTPPMHALQDSIPNVLQFLQDLSWRPLQLLRDAPLLCDRKLQFMKEYVNEFPLIGT